MDLLPDLPVGGDAGPVVLLGLGVAPLGPGDIPEHPVDVAERVLVPDLDEQRAGLLGQGPRLLATCCRVSSWYAASARSWSRSRSALAQASNAGLPDTWNPLRKSPW